MNITINKPEFHDIFNKTRPDQFSYQALNALYDYLEEIENFTLDVIAICCEFTEYTIDELKMAYLDHALEDIMDETLVLETEDGKFIVQEF